MSEAADNDSKSCLLRLATQTQVSRGQDWNYRREAYQNLALRLGGIAEESFERVYALAPG